ncbi:MAG: cupredoxin family protein [Hyphomonadaceae bacterium]|jgi:uncharacterized cupredoxin-like copper-binding protein|nr:cupredoxin family protein [Hyphomonadaceae bacterium]
MSRRLAVAGLSLAALLAAGLPIYGGMSPIGAVAHTGSTFAAGEPGDAKQPFRVIEITMTDGPGTMSYTPDKIDVRRGEQVKFVLKNTGYLPHEFLLDSFENNAKHKAEMAKNPEMEHEEPNGKRLEPKKSAELLWRFTKSGTFEFACLIPGHYETGMKGIVTVK